MILTPSEVLIRGFRAYSGLPNDHNGTLNQKDVTTFKKIYGSSPSIIAFIWSAISTSEQYVNSKEISEKGFKSFLMAVHFLWAYPKNSEILALAFGVSVKQAQGTKLWNSIGMIASLKFSVIIWPTERYDDPNTPIFIVSVDGVDFKCTEKQHQDLPYDRQWWSQKFSKAAIKYEIAIDVYKSKCVWVSPPHRGGKHDKTIFLEDLRAKIPLLIVFTALRPMSVIMIS